MGTNVATDCPKQNPGLGNPCQNPSASVGTIGTVTRLGRRNSIRLPRPLEKNGRETRRSISGFKRTFWPSRIPASHLTCSSGILRFKSFDKAQAYCDKASAQIAMHDISGAVESYEEALRCEEVYPQVKTNACILLSVLIAREGLTNRYAQALDLLEKYRDRVLLPIDLFWWNCVLAIVLNETGRPDEAVAVAKAAVEAAEKNHWE